MIKNEIMNDIIIVASTTINPLIENKYSPNFKLVNNSFSQRQVIRKESKIIINPDFFLMSLMNI
jgi:hypothetical protein